MRALWHSLDPSFEERLEQVEEWLKDCCANHICGEKTSKILPKRLLDIGPMDSGMCPNLVLASLIKGKIQYATLSHCWGPPEVKSPLKTTMQTEKEFMKGIPPENLPQNARDAITVIRKLGIRYLWIDSLCILQDSKLEWVCRICQHGKHLPGSYLTIADGVSADSRGGFIRDYNLSYKLALGSEPHLRTVPISVGLESQMIMLKYPDHIGDGLESPLNQRAWTLQELGLSPRTVLFTAGEMDWQCRNHYESEIGFRTINFNLVRGFDGYGDSRFDADDPKEATTMWADWMQDYASRRITYASDRTPAIAGIVDYYRLIMNYTPLLGLWRETLQTDLGWFLTTPQPRSESQRYDIHKHWPITLLDMAICLGSRALTNENQRPRIGKALSLLQGSNVGCKMGEPAFLICVEKLSPCSCRTCQRRIHRTRWGPNFCTSPPWRY